MLSFFTRSSKSRKNDKHSAKQQLDPKSQHHVVAQQNGKEDVDRYKSERAEAAACANQREIVAVQHQQQHHHHHDADNIVGPSYRTFTETQHSEHETVGERRRAGNLFTVVVSATENASTPSTVDRGTPLTAKPTTSTPLQNIPKAPSSASQSTPLSSTTTKLSSFFGEIMAKGRNRRHNQSVKKNKQLQQQQQQNHQQQPQATQLIASSIKEINRNSFNSPNETTPVTKTNDHLHSNSNDNNDAFYNESTKPAQIPLRDFDPPTRVAIFKNSPNQVDFIDDDYDDDADKDARQSDDDDDDDNAAMPNVTERRNSATTGREFCDDDIVRVLRASKAIDQGIPKVTAIDTTDRTVRANSEIDICNSSAIDDSNQRERESFLFGAHSLVASNECLLSNQTSDNSNDLRHSPRSTHTNQNSGAVKNSRPYDEYHHDDFASSLMKSANEVVAENSTGVASLRKLGDQTNFERPSKLQAESTDSIALLLLPATGHQTSIELDLISDCADVTRSLQMGQQPTKAPAAHNSPTQRTLLDQQRLQSDSQQSSTPQVCIQSSTPPSAASSLDERDIFYEAVDNKNFTNHANLVVASENSKCSAVVDTETVNCLTEGTVNVSVNDDERLSTDVCVQSESLLSSTEYCKEENENNDSDSDDEEDENEIHPSLPTFTINDDNRLPIPQFPSEDTDDDSDDDNNAEDDDYDYCEEDDGNNHRKHMNDDDADEADSDDPENDSPDSGIDVLADSATAANLPAASADSTDTNNNNRQVLLSAKSNLLTSGGEHLVRSTSSGLESDLSDDPVVVVDHIQGQHTNNSVRSHHSAFSGPSVVVLTDNTMVHKKSTSVDQNASEKSAGNNTNPWSDQDDASAVSISLPDIVESIGANNNSPTTVTIGNNNNNNNNVMMVSAAKKHGVQHGRDSNCSASSSDSESSEYEKENNRSSQEIMQEKM